MPNIMIKFVELNKDSNANERIQEELHLADIKPVKATGYYPNKFPQNLQGRLGDWHFQRGKDFWYASTLEGKGFVYHPIAYCLDNKPYPVKGENQPKTLGEVIIPLNGSTPDSLEKCVRHYAPNGRELFRVPEGTDIMRFRESLECLQCYTPNVDFVYELIPPFVSLINKYNITTLPGLIAFAKVVKEVNYAT